MRDGVRKLIGPFPRAHLAGSPPAARANQRRLGMFSGLTLYFCGLLLVSTAAAAPVTPPNTWKQFTASEGTSWTVHWDRSGKVPNVLRPRRAHPLQGWAANPERAVRSFFERNSALFGLRPGLDKLEVA